MHFVDDGIAERNARRTVMLPVEVWTGDDALRHAGGAVPPVDDQIGILTAKAIRKDRLVPINAAGNCLGVGINQQLGRIEPQAARRLPRSVNPITVELPRLKIWHITMPDEGGLFRQLYAVAFATASPVVQTQFHLGRVFRIESKIHSGSVPGCTQGIRFAGQAGSCHSSSSKVGEPLIWMQNSRIRHRKKDRVCGHTFQPEIASY